jgi:periplasmic nitrate reductase NapD
MDEPTKAPDVNRRKFLKGQWAKHGDEKSAESCEIASVLVQAKPECLAAAVQAIEKLQGAQIYSRDPKGKLVVVIEATDVGSIGATLNVITNLPEVLTAALVFHGTDKN